MSGAPPQRPNLDQDAWYTHSSLADHFGVPREALRKRLDRFRGSHLDGWKENTDRRPREAKHLYQLKVVLPVIEEMLPSSERPAK